jgi:hypothetical protein
MGKSVSKLEEGWLRRIQNRNEMARVRLGVARGNSTLDGFMPPFMAQSEIDEMYVQEYREAQTSLPSGGILEIGCW